LGAIEAREFFRQRIKRTGAREKTLFPNEASNDQLGGQFAAVAGFVIHRAREKGLPVTCPRNGLPKHCCRDARDLSYRIKQSRVAVKLLRASAGNRIKL
jgi:hypothetical protein